jgi:hypothetical protein
LYDGSSILPDKQIHRVGSDCKFVKLTLSGVKHSSIESFKVVRDNLQNFKLFNVVEENGVRRVVFGTGPFYLEHQYTRAANAAIAAAKEQIDQGSTENPNGNIFAKVAEYCDAWGLQNGFDFPSQPYLDCWTNKLAEYPASETMGTTEAVRVPSTSLFRYDYASPIWYPCASGILILIILILSLVIVVRFIIWLCIRIAIIFIK